MYQDSKNCREGSKPEQVKLVQGGKQHTTSGRSLLLYATRLSVFYSQCTFCFGSTELVVIHSVVAWQRFDVTIKREKEKERERALDARSGGVWTTKQTMGTLRLSGLPDAELFQIQKARGCNTHYY